MPTLLAVAVVSCARSSGPVQQATPVPTSSSKSSADAHLLGRDGPLESGRVSWEGVVRPTKGGFDVRGVTLDDEALRARLAVDVVPADRDWFLGALVRVTATLAKRHVDSALDDAGMAMQTKVGDFFVMTALESVELVARPVVLEGTLARSKGFFAVGGRLVSPHDVAWAIPGAKEGTKVRLWGQPHDYTCGPEEQCLVGGVLPLFDVGRGETVP